MFRYGEHERQSIISRDPSKIPVVKGTTTVGLRVKDGVVLAADKRATAGYYIAHKKVRKIARIHDKIALTMSGVVADAQAIADILRVELKYYELFHKATITVKAAATLASNILFSSRILPYVVQLIIAGYDTQPRVYALDLFGTVTEEKYIATGSGSPIAIGILERRYNENMDIVDAAKLAVMSVNAALQRDVATGEGIDLVVITVKEYKEFSEDEVKKLMAETKT